MNEGSPGRTVAVLTVVVLAGGLSRRFGRDKLAVPVEGIPALTRVAQHVTPLSSRLVLSVSSESRGRELSPLVTDAFEVWLDDSSSWGEGPGGAIASALGHSSQGPLLFVPGDVPWLESASLHRFVACAERTNADVACPYWASGETEHLLQWHRSGVAGRASPHPSHSSRHGPRASDTLRSAPRTLLIPVGELTQDGSTFGHLTFPSDLDRPESRGEWGEALPLRSVEGSPKIAHREAEEAQAMGARAVAREAFLREARWYREASLPLLARHAQEDSARLAP